MTDNEDGTFSYTYTINSLIKHSIFIKTYETPGVSVYYFHNLDINKEPDFTEIKNDINVNIPSGVVFPGCEETCRVVYDFVLIGPTTGFVNLTVKSTGGANLYFNDQDLLTVREDEETYEVTMEENKLYF